MAKLHLEICPNQLSLRSRPLLKVATTALTCCLLLVPGHQIARAAGAPDCSPAAAAGKPLPPTVSRESKNAFKVIWHIATQIEDLAAANDETRQTIAGIQKDVDGYFLAALPTQVGYFPNRPTECQISFPRAPASLGRDGAAQRKQECQQRFNDTIKQSDARQMSAAGAYEDALRRVVTNLDIKAEQANGKTLIAQMLLRRDDFGTDNEKTKFVLKKLPTTYCFLNAAGVLPNSIFVYQEPHVQIQNGRLLSMPAPRQRTNDRQQRRGVLPYNLPMIELVGDSFDEANVPLQNFLVNVRRWDERMINALEKAAGSKRLAGIFFEGGAEIISTKRRPVPRIDNFAEGISWLLANTEYKVFVLMPGFWEQNQLTSDAERDELIDRVRTTVTSLNGKIAQKLGSDQNAKPICNGRLSFIVGSYGSPEHVKPLPPERNGKLAGTVTGQIKLLAQIRRDMCGTSG